MQRSRQQLMYQLVISGHKNVYEAIVLGSQLWKAMEERLLLARSLKNWHGQICCQRSIISGKGVQKASAMCPVTKSRRSRTSMKITPSSSLCRRLAVSNPIHLTSSTSLGTKPNNARGRQPCSTIATAATASAPKFGQSSPPSPSEIHMAP